MKISVIVACLNYGRYIDKAIRSIYAQDLNAELYEIIVVDGGSADNTAEMMSPYRKKGNFKFFVQSGKGLSNACNEGIKSSSGRYIIRLDADDVFYNGILKMESEVLDRDQDIDFVYPDYVAYIEGKKEYRVKRLPPFDPEELSSRGDFLSGGTMFRRSLFERIGFYDETLPTIESYEFLLRMLKNKIEGRHIAEPLFEYRIHKKSMSANNDLIKRVGAEIAGRYHTTYRTNKNHPHFIEEDELC